MNMEFRYLYRDYGNWKNYGTVIFGNENGLDKESLQDRVMDLIGVDHFIDVLKLGLPPLYFSDFPYDPKLDHEEHEFCELAETNSPANDLANRDIVELLATMAIPQFVEDFE